MGPVRERSFGQFFTSGGLLNFCRVITCLPITLLQLVGTYSTGGMLLLLAMCVHVLLDTMQEPTVLFYLLNTLAACWSVLFVLALSHMLVSAAYAARHRDPLGEHRALCRPFLFPRYDRFLIIFHFEPAHSYLYNNPLDFEDVTCWEARRVPPLCSALPAP